MLRVLDTRDAETGDPRQEKQSRVRELQSNDQRSGNTKESLGHVSVCSFPRPTDGFSIDGAKETRVRPKNERARSSM